MRPSVSHSRSSARRQLSRGLRAQRGAAAIEAALLFVIFFTLFYAIVSYSLPLMMMQGFQHAASAGARAAVAVDNPNTEDYHSRVISQVNTVVGESLTWLPSAAHNAVFGGTEGVKVSFDQPITGMLTVTVQFLNYTDNPLIPILSLPGIGNVPQLPQDLTGSAAVQL